MSDDVRVPEVQLLVDGQPADAALKGAIIGVRVTDELDRASRFQVHLSDKDRAFSGKEKLEPGMAVEIKLGYVGELQSVCKGEVSSLEFVLTPDGPTRVVLSGVDKGHRFDQGTVTRTYKDKKDSDLATEIAQRHGLTADVEDSKVVHPYVIQNNLSDYDFLMQRAAIAGFRMYVADKKLVFKKPNLREPAAAKLTWRENIGRFVQEINTFGQVSKITATGWDAAKMEAIDGAAKKGAEYGTQGGTVTGEKLVKQMFGDIEAVIPVSTGQKNLLEAIANAEYNKRAGTFVHAEARVRGNPAIRAGSVVEVDKAGKRVSGEYYVVSADHVYFVDTGYATEFRARRYAIKKADPQPKDVAKVARAAQEEAKKAQELAEKVKDAAAFSLKAAREAAQRANQAVTAAKQVWDEVNQALEEVKGGNADVAQAALKTVEGKLAALAGYVSQAESKVGEAEQETASAKSDSAREALDKAREAAAQVTAVAKQAVQHAHDAHDAVKAAALDHEHTNSDEPSAKAQGLKKSLLASADAAVKLGKAGLSLAQAANVQGQKAIEMCAAQAAAAAKPLVEALGAQLDKVTQAVKGSSDAAGKSVLGAIASGAQHAIDEAKKAISAAQEAIAKAKDAVKKAEETIKKNVVDKLKGAIAQARKAVEQVKQAVDDAKKQFEAYKKQAEELADKYGGKWIEAGLYLKDHGEKAYKAGKALFDGVKKGLALLKEKKWDEAEKEIDPAQRNFATAKSEAQLCFDKLQEIEKDIPESVKSALQATVDKLRAMLPQGESTLSKFVEAVKARVGKLAAQAKEAAEKGRKIYQQVKAEVEKAAKNLEQLKEFYEAARDAVSLGEKVWAEGKEAVAKCKAALRGAKGGDWEPALKDAEDAKAKFESAKKDAEECFAKAEEAYEKLPDRVRAALEKLVEKLESLMGSAEKTLAKTHHAVKQKDKDAVSGAEGAHEETEQLLATGFDAAKKELESVAQEVKKQLTSDIDRLLKKVDDELLAAAKKVLEKALSAASKSWELDEKGSAADAEATKQLAEAMKKSFEDVRAELAQLTRDFKGAQKAADGLLGHLATGHDAAADTAEKSAAAAQEVQDSPVRKADEHTKGAEAAHDQLAKEHEAGKDKAEGEVKKFVGQLKEQYAKLHQAGGQMHGPLGETLKKSGVTIDKSEGVQMAQARGAVDQVALAHGAAKTAFDEAQKHREGLQRLTGHVPELRDHVDGAFAKLQGAFDQGQKAFDEAKRTVKEHEKEIESEAKKLTANAQEAIKKAEEALAKAKERMEKNQALFRRLPQRKGSGEAANAAGSAAKSATGAAESATSGSKDARGAALGACRAPDDEKVRDSALAAIGELEQAAKKAEETANKAESAVDSAASGDTASAQKQASEAQGAAQATAAATGSASEGAKKSEQGAAAAAAKKEPPREEAPKKAAEEPRTAERKDDGAKPAGAQGAAGGAAGQAPDAQGAADASITDRAPKDAGEQAEKAQGLADQAQGAAGAAQDTASQPAVAGGFAGAAEQDTGLIGKAQAAAGSAQDAAPESDVKGAPEQVEQAKRATKEKPRKKGDG